MGTSCIAASRTKATMQLPNASNATTMDTQLETAGIQLAAGSVERLDMPPLSGAAQPSPELWLEVAPDDDRYCTLDSDGKWRVRHLSGGTAKPIPNLSADDQILSWTADGKTVFVEARGSGSARRTDRIDVETGNRMLWREDPDPKGLHEMWMSLITPDGKTRVYTFGRGISSLWIAEGLSGVRHTGTNSSGVSTSSGPCTARLSGITGSGRSRSAKRFRTLRRTAGNWISPARWSSSRSPRHTMSRNAPLACFHCQAWQSCRDSFQRLSWG